MIDSSAVCVHKHGSSSRRDDEQRGLVGSHGGLTTNIHAAVDGEGRSPSVRLFPRQAADSTYAPNLLAGVKTETKVTDTILILGGYTCGDAIGPSMTNRKKPGELNRSLYTYHSPRERLTRKTKEFQKEEWEYWKLVRNQQSTVLTAEPRYFLQTPASQSTESSL